MPDLFTACEGEPTTWVAGDLWQWRKDDLAGDYPPASFALSYTLTPISGGTIITITGAADGDGYLVTVPATTTAGYAAGQYKLAGIMTRSSDNARRVFLEDVITVDPDPATSTSDTRGPNRRIYDAIMARLEGRVTKDAEAYTIEGRSITRTPLEVLQKMAGKYRRLAEQEEGGGSGFNLTKWNFDVSN